MIKEWIYNILIFAGLIALITAAWQLAELKVYGYTIPSNIDSVITLILANSLFFNLKFYMKNNTFNKNLK